MGVVIIKQNMQQTAVNNSARSRVTTQTVGEGMERLVNLFTIIFLPSQRREGAVQLTGRLWV